MVCMFHPESLGEDLLYYYRVRNHSQSIDMKLVLILVHRVPNCEVIAAHTLNLVQPYYSGLGLLSDVFI